MNERCSLSNFLILPALKGKLSTLVPRALTYHMESTRLHQHTLKNENLHAHSTRNLERVPMTELSARACAGIDNLLSTEQHHPLPAVERVRGTHPAFR